ncbi:MAG TPA: hypothetical protein VHB21_24185 [Minicystis sp.]|nr:hypothetical protein [Minicystis sp.]
MPADRPSLAPRAVELRRHLPVVQPRPPPDGAVTSLFVRTFARVDDRGLASSAEHVYCTRRARFTSPEACATCPRAATPWTPGADFVACLVEPPDGAPTPSGVLARSIVVVEAGTKLARLGAIATPPREAVVVGADGRPLGYVRELGVHRARAPGDAIERFVRPLPTLEVAEPVSRALAAMVHHHARAVCLVGDDGAPTGLVHDLDAMARVTRRGTRAG